MLLAFGDDPIDAYRTMFRSSLQGWRSFTRTLTYATPLILTGLAAAVAFKLRVYNIGAEGQLFAGAIAASGLALALPEGMPKVIMVTIVHRRRGARRGGVGAIGGGAQGDVRHRRGHHDAHAQLHRPRPDELPDPGLAVVLEEPDAIRFRRARTSRTSAQLPDVYERLHAGFFIAIGAAVAVWLAMRSTSWGFRVQDGR